MKSVCKRGSRAKISKKPLTSRISPFKGLKQYSGTIAADQQKILALAIRQAIND